MHVIKLSMIQGKLYGLYGSYDIHYMWDMALTCNGTLHCIMHRNIAFHECECMVRI